jgi:hypothetical protein
MSRRTRKDYKGILKIIVNKILKNNIAVTQCVMDFEKAVWLAIGDVFGDDIELFGCGISLDPMYFSPVEKTWFNKCIPK